MEKFGFPVHTIEEIRTFVGNGAPKLLERSIPDGVANPDYELKSGMYASIQLPYEAEPDAIMVKDAAIGTDQLGKYVYVVNDSDKVVYTPIRIGDLVRDSLRIVNSGLTVKDRYVTKALMKVRDGMEVNPVVVK